MSKSLVKENGVQLHFHSRFNKTIPVPTVNVSIQNWYMQVYQLEDRPQNLSRQNLLRFLSGNSELVSFCFTGTKDTRLIDF